MNVGLWQVLCGLRSEVTRVLDRTLLLSSSSAKSAAAGGGGRTVFRSHTRLAREDGGRVGGATLMLSGGGERASSAGILPVDPALLERLRDELLGCLEVLDEKLSKELPESEVQLVLFPLVLLCDELVMVRLPKEQHTHWHLLQADLFQINYGGDVFYEFADEHLGKETSPGIVFEVLYYCLSAGFVGRFGLDTGKVKRYRGLLSERIQKHVDTAAEAKPAEKLDAPSLVGPRRSRHRSVGTAERRSRAVTLSYYVVAVLVASLCIAALAVFTNF